MFFMFMYLSGSFVMNDMGFWLHIMEWRPISRITILIVFIVWEFAIYIKGLDL